MMVAPATGVDVISSNDIATVGWSTDIPLRSAMFVTLMMIVLMQMVTGTMTDKH